MSGPLPDPWSALAAFTPARIALGRAGASPPTREVLAFALAHAQARDAVHARLDRAALARDLAALGLACVEVESEACDRQVYLCRPDLGRRLQASSRTRLAARALADRPPLVLVIGDGLSATAVARHAPVLIREFLPLATKSGLSLGPLVLAEGARVALGDEIGGLLGARFVAVLIGERPGLSAADSMSVYLTREPRAGRTDAERNCISNIRPGGLPPSAAARSLAWLIEAAMVTGATGVALKDRSDVALPSVSDGLLGPLPRATGNDSESMTG
ncbi:MAG: ethanolamine ammonia-lyase subunit EutC [Hyphomicrobiaceae bacterium]|nr:ethanolamine ammonia-lyase subunit EutC [Hyphomicrobiaceae bacterium]